MADVSKIRVDGIDYDLKDATARSALEKSFSTTATTITEEGDLNAITSIGLYIYASSSSNTIANVPEKASQTTMIVLPGLTNGSTKNRIQIAITQNNNIYVRNFVDGTWYDWRTSTLPAVTTSDNGKILKVVNGVWTAVAES